MNHLDNLSDIEIIYNGTFTIAGLNIEMEIYKRGVICSIHIKFSGTITYKDPVIYTLSKEHAPLTTHRLLGYNSGNIILYPNGNIVISAGIGANFQGSQAEVGYSWLCNSNIG